MIDRKMTVTEASRHFSDLVNRSFYRGESIVLVRSGESVAMLWADLEERGERIGPHDMLIAATCLRFGFRVVTLNEGEFRRVGGLALADARGFRMGS